MIDLQIKTQVFKWALEIQKVIAATPPLWICKGGLGQAY